LCRYVVVSNILAATSANPFDTREAKVYQQDPEIQVIEKLRDAYDNVDIEQFEKLLRNERSITEDALISMRFNVLEDSE